MASLSVSHAADTNNSQHNRQKVHLIWLTDGIDELKKNFLSSLTHLESIVSSVDYFSNTDLFINFLFEINHEKVLIIVNGTLGKSTVPVIHDAHQLDSIFVFCYNRARHEQWAKDWKKVKGVFSKIDEMCQAVEQVVQPKTTSVVHRPVTPEPPRRSTRPDITTTEGDQQSKPRDKHPPQHDRPPLPIRDSVVKPGSEPSGDRQKSIKIATNREVVITADPKFTRTDAAFRQQRDAVVSNKSLRDAVQQWSEVSSMADLVDAIKTQGKDDLERAWLLFCWIGQNIQYQAHCNNNAAQTVFRAKKGVCRGFVSLYHECCSLLGIECSEISGYAKQDFLKPGEELKESPHAWNSIVLDKYVYLVDPTWGAGGRDNKNKLEDFYFITSPEEFIYTHYCKGYQLLKPEISREEFLSLPVMSSVYYELGLTLLSPKQGLNETNENLFKIAVQTPEHVDLFVTLKVDDTEYPRSFHTLCQRDEIKSDVLNCYVAPPVDGLYQVAVFATKDREKKYTQAIKMRLRVSNIAGAFTFPTVFSDFTEQKCILIEPLRRFVHKNEKILIHMIIPNGNVIKIQNGEDQIVPCMEEYKKGVLKKYLRVHGDLHVRARWDDNADSISTICTFNMI